jgi:hypothetical protein
VFATFDGQQLLTLQNAVPLQSDDPRDASREGAPSEGNNSEGAFSVGNPADSPTSDAGSERQGWDTFSTNFGSLNEDASEESPDEQVETFGRLIGEPAASDSLLAPDSSDESMREGAPSDHEAEYEAVNRYWAEVLQQELNADPPLRRPPRTDIQELMSAGCHGPDGYNSPARAFTSIEASAVLLNCQNDTAYLEAKHRKTAAEAHDANQLRELPGLRR